MGDEDIQDCRQYAISNDTPQQQPPIVWEFFGIKLRQQSEEAPAKRSLFVSSSIVLSLTKHRSEEADACATCLKGVNIAY
jgi:hypothetical protein